LTSGGISPGRFTGGSSGLGVVPGRPTSWSSASFLTSRSFSAAICCAVTRSKRACASRVSVMVLVPTSKLRLAEASCSDTAVLLAATKATASCAASTSK
jgi:hypothetical protein